MIKNALFLFFVCAAIFVFYLPAYVKMQDLSGKNCAYEKRISDLEQENKALGVERDRLINDPAYFEKMARQRIGLIKENEVIYKVVAQGTKAADEASDVAPPAKKKVAGARPEKSAQAKTADAKKVKKASSKKSLQQKKKTSAIISKSKTGKMPSKTSSSERKTVLKDAQKSSSAD